MAVQQHLPEIETVRRLKARCIYDLDKEDQQILAALDFGHWLGEIAAGCALSERSVSRRIKRLCDEIANSLKCPASDRMLCHWFRLHKTCCTVHGHKMAENGQIFASR
jgi:hypothetical protein